MGSEVINMFPNADGWTCGQCGVWVPSGTLHVCPNSTAQPYSNPSPSYTVFFGPCFGTDHNFSVSHGHAICNRCEKVVEFETKFTQVLKRSVAWCRSKFFLTQGVDDE